MSIACTHALRTYVVGRPKQGAREAGCPGSEFCASPQQDHQPETEAADCQAGPTRTVRAVSLGCPTFSQPARERATEAADCQPGPTRTVRTVAAGCQGSEFCASSQREHQPETEADDRPTRTVRAVAPGCQGSEFCAPSQRDHQPETGAADCQPGPTRTARAVVAGWPGSSLCASIAKYRHPSLLRAGGASMCCVLLLRTRGARVCSC